MSSWSPCNSLILGTFSDPPTYVIHYLDTHLTVLQSFQICSLFGRIRVHGYNLHPSTYYSIHNYRTNHPISIEYNPSITNSLQDIISLIPDIQLAKRAFNHVQEKGGDIILVRKEPNNDSLFIKTIREHHMYRDWFLEKFSLFQNDQWRELEKNLHVRLIETTNKTAIMPSEEFIKTTDHIINRWLNETTEGK